MYTWVKGWWGHTKCRALIYQIAAEDEQRVEELRSGITKSDPELEARGERLWASMTPEEDMEADVLLGQYMRERGWPRYNYQGEEIIIASGSEEEEEEEREEIPQLFRTVPIVPIPRPVPQADVDMVVPQADVEMAD